MYVTTDAEIAKNIRRKNPFPRIFSALFLSPFPKAIVASGPPPPPTICANAAIRIIMEFI